MDTKQSLIDFTNQWIKNYPTESFHDYRMNSLILRLIDVIFSGGGVTGTGMQKVRVTSANFTTPTDCPLTALDGLDLDIYWYEGNKWLLPTEWTPYVGGGFTVTIPDFDATADNYHFLVLAS